jgi:antirestriction protein ArdC
VFWKRIEVKKTESNDNGDALTDDKGRKFRLIARGYSVFNAAQVDGYCPKARPVISEAERDAIAESYFAAIPARVEHGGNRACYYPGADYIRLPEFEQFKSGGHYYATRGHESGHWTGHESRCNRDFSGRFGDQAYAAEELVAELAAAFLCAMLGLENEPRPDHAQYLAHWLGILKGDKRAIFTAASKAQGAVDFLNNAATANGFRFPEGAEAEAEGEGEADGPEAIGDDDAAEGEGEGEAERLAA